MTWTGVRTGGSWQLREATARFTSGAAQTGRSEAPLTGHAGAASRPSGAPTVAASHRRARIGTVRIFDVLTGQEVLVLRGHQGPSGMLRGAATAFPGLGRKRSDGPHFAQSRSPGGAGTPPGRNARDDEGGMARPPPAISIEYSRSRKPIATCVPAGIERILTKHVGPGAPGRLLEIAAATSWWRIA